MSQNNSPSKRREVSLLHTVAQVYDYNKLENILNNGANPNITDGNQRTPLHIVLSDGFLGHLNLEKLEACVLLLLKSGADPNARDCKGMTPLYLAIENKFSKCAKLLLRFEADISISPYREPGNVTLATKLSLTMTDVMMDVFDEAVTYTTNSYNGESLIRLDWRPILQYKKIVRKDEEQPAFYEPGRKQKETSFLYSLLDGNYSTRKILLTHPLISSFLHLKNEKVQRRFFIFYVVVILFPIMYMAFIDYLYFIQCKKRVRKSSNNTVASEFANGEDDETGGKETCEITILISLFSYFLTIVVVVWSAIEIYMLLKMDVAHLSKWRTWVTGVTLTLMMLSLWPGLQFETMEITFQYPIAALGIFMAWVIFLLQIGSYPAFAVYIEVLVQILLTVVKICILFLPLLVGFYMGFSLLFLDTSRVFRFIIMMVDIGTAEYEEILDRPREEAWWYDAVTYTFCVLFIVIITIVFMNFVLGSAINDIQKLKYEAKISNISRTVENLLTIDLLDPRCRIVSSKNLDSGELFYEFSPNNGKSYVPEDVKTRLIEIIKKRKAKESENIQENSNTMIGNSFENAAALLAFNKKFSKLEHRLTEMALKLDAFIP